MLLLLKIKKKIANKEKIIYNCIKTSSDKYIPLADNIKEKAKNVEIFQSKLPT